VPKPADAQAAPAAGTSRRSVGARCR
jgi:hypothetical protein